MTSRQTTSSARASRAAAGWGAGARAASCRAKARGVLVLQRLVGGGLSRGFCDLLAVCRLLRTVLRKLLLVGGDRGAVRNLPGHRIAIGGGGCRIGRLLVRC